MRVGSAQLLKMFGVVAGESYKIVEWSEEIFYRSSRKYISGVIRMMLNYLQ
jgi:hypothetical protein